MSDGSIHCSLDLIQLKWFWQVGEGPHFNEGLLVFSHLPRNHDYRRIGMALLDALQNFNTAKTRHRNIGYHHVVLFKLKEFQRLLSAVG